ncbi:MAG TPA: UvrD-helicase domain-containing protein [Acidimicrobiales bacterium]|nr:UvrD-helicase domain-containing protein [Acidimicrobiales bacterium]
MIDDSARRAVRDNLDETLFVEAGAGTGKTSELVRRVLALTATQRASLGAVAAITFTEAAAADLRERIHDELVRESARPGGDWAGSALHELDNASMTTIHGFAQRILLEHPLAAGLPLRLRVLDEIQSDTDFERRFATFLDALLDDPDSEVLVAASLAIGVTLGHLRQLASEIDQAWDRHRTPGKSPALTVESLGTDVDAATDRVIDAMRALRGRRESCTNGADTLGELIGRIETDLDRATRLVDWADRLRWLCSIGPWRAGHKGRKEDWKGLDVAEIRAEVAGLDDLRSAHAAKLREAVLDALVLRLGSEAVSAAERRRRSGELCFHDLLVFTRDLLAGDPDVRRAVSTRYSHILVDEFQDTDPLQLEILRLLGQDSAGRAIPGKLFFVGDPRQSIYRFRGAAPEVYAAAMHDLVPSGPVRLTTNFRSAPGIIDWVNGVFAPLFAPADGREAASPTGSGYAPLGPHRRRGSRAPVSILGAAANAKVSAHERREREGADIAAVVVAAVREEWPVETTTETRPVRYGDIAILLTRRTGLSELEAALDAADVPFRVDSTSLVYSSPEVRDLLACLRAVDSAGDEAAIITALRTPMLACGDDDLLRYRRQGGIWSLEESPGVVPDDPVAAALGRLTAIAARRHLLGVVGTLEAVVRDFEVFELAALSRHGREAVRRLRFVVDQARAFAESGGATTAEMLEWMDRQAAGRVRARETAMGEADDAVRILTIHAAKGLEFPVVIVAELGGIQQSPTARKAVLFDAAGRAEVRLRRDVETTGFAPLAEAELVRATEEDLRLCYVAMTRARDHLVVSLRRSTAAERGRPSLAERIASRLEDLGGLWQDASIRAVPRATKARSARSGRPPAPRGPAADPESFARWRAGRAEVTRRAARLTSVAASELAALVGRDSWAAPVPWSTGEDEPADQARWKSRRAATAIGRAVHGVLQRADLAGDIRLDELARDEAFREGCADRVDEVAALARSAFATPIVVAAAAARNRWRELPVTVPVEGGVLEGVVDLCFPEGDRLIVVDYKTDLLPSAAAVPASARRYRMQAGAYALALATALARPVDRVVFVFLAPPDGAVEYEVADLGDAVADARRALAAAMAGPAVA